MSASLNSDKLGKLLALASSDNDHEALSALRMAKGLLTTAGMDFKDVADRMSKPKASTSDFDFSAAWAAAQRQPSPPPKPKGYTKDGYTWESKAAHDAYMAQERAWFERSRLEHADERAAVIAKYGTAAKASARDKREQALHDAVAAWLVPQTGCKPKGRWSKDLDGWTQFQALDKAPTRVVEAIKAAVPLPTTIGTAIAELTAWRARDREIELALEDYVGNGGLDLPAELRCDILRHLIETELPTADIADVIVRMEYAEASHCTYTTSDIAGTVLADLRRLLPTLSPSQPEPVAPPRRKKNSRAHPDQLNLLEWPV